MMTRLDVTDHRTAGAIAAAGATSYRRCTEQNGGGSQCVYGAGHSVETHLFDDGSRA